MTGEARYAGLVTRAVAIVIDALVIDAVALVVTGAVALIKSLFALPGSHQALVIAAGTAVFIIWVAAYFVTFWATTGQTPGGRVMQIRVTRPDGGRVGPARALLRLGWLVLSLPLFWGYVPVLWTRHRRGVPDLAAGTVVAVVEPPPVPPSPRLRALEAHRSGIQPPTTTP
jgi:uncharacterized RDD family membrane protein YckC